MDRGKLVLCSSVLAALLAALSPLLVGLFHPGYSHLRDYISELGAVGAPAGWLIMLVGFFPIGLFVAVVALGLPPYLPPHPHTRLACFLLLTVSASYWGAILFPCDAGCPAVGSERQAIHNLLGLVSYLGVAGSLFLFAGIFRAHPAWRSLWPTALGLGVALLVVLGFMATPDLEVWRGAWQRMAEGILFGWLLLLTLRARTHTPSDA